MSLISLRTRCHHWKIICIIPRECRGRLQGPGSVLVVLFLHGGVQWTQAMGKLEPPWAFVPRSLRWELILLVMVVSYRAILCARSQTSGFIISFNAYKGNALFFRWGKWSTDEKYVGLDHIAKVSWSPCRNPQILSTLCVVDCADLTLQHAFLYPLFFLGESALLQNKVHSILIET